MEMRRTTTMVMTVMMNWARSKVGTSNPRRVPVVGGCDGFRLPLPLRSEVASEGVEEDDAKASAKCEMHQKLRRVQSGGW